MINTHIEGDFMSRNLKVFIFEDLHNGKLLMYKHDGTSEEVDRDKKDVEPTFVIKDNHADSILQALADRGLKTNNDHKIAGTLEATRDHLKDMQKIVFDHGLLRGTPAISIEGDNTGTIHTEGKKGGLL